jgi:hypothetical protein
MRAQPDPARPEEHLSRRGFIILKNDQSVEITASNVKRVMARATQLVPGGGSGRVWIGLLCAR